MGWIRRVTLSVGIAVCVGASISIASVGAAGGFGSGAGTTTFYDTNGFVNFFDPVSQASLNVSVDTGTFMFRPRGGGGVQTQVMTVMSLSYFLPDLSNPDGPPLVSDSGCFVIPGSDFVVASGLQSASLNATVDESNLCPGFLIPLTGAVADGKGGGGGGSTGFTFPLTVSASWTGTGELQSSENQGSFRCDTFVALMHSHSQSALSALVSATVSGIGTFSGASPLAFGNVSMSTNTFMVAGNGILSAGCGGGTGG